LEWAIKQEISSSRAPPENGPAVRPHLLTKFSSFVIHILHITCNNYSVDHHTVMREDSLCNQIIAQDFMLIGNNYLRQMLRVEVMKIIRSPSASDRRVADSASCLLKEICSSLSYCPKYCSHPPPVFDG
jgi:hypothetical protein